MTLAEITSAVTGLLTDYVVYISAGAVIGLAVWFIRRMVKGMR